MNFDKPITDIIQQRFSCRNYLETPLDAARQQTLLDFLAPLRTGPLGTPLRFDLVAATQQDREALKGLGTYGFIKGECGFLVGAVQHAEKDLEDFGYVMEQAVLKATDLGLGTCWLGGSFTRSSFARNITATENEQIPAVASIGYIEDLEQARNNFIRLQVRGNQRLPWEQLFFQQKFGAALSHAEAGEYAVTLEMVRWGPSASNKQPWRIVRDNHTWHFYMQRTKGYRDNLFSKVMSIADLQRVDLGIALCHFELTARQQGIQGQWRIQEPDIARPDDLCEYTVSWVS